MGAVIGALAGLGAAPLVLAGIGRCSRRPWPCTPATTAAVIAACAVAGGWASSWAGYPQVAAAWWVLLVAGVGLAVVDVREHRLPDLLVAAAAAGVLAALTAATVASGDWTSWWRAIAVAAAAFVVMYLVAMATDIGFGDVKLIAVIAGCAGYGSVSAAFAAVFAGYMGASVAGLAVLAVTRQRGQALAMGPWLLLGAAATLAGAG